MKRVLLQPAYILHRRLYRETSFLVELFTPEYGRLTTVARGMRKTRSASPGLLQPFTPVLVSWAGSGELMSLAHVEGRGEVKRLCGECLFSGLYLNELLICLLQKWDAHGRLFYAYEKAINALQKNTLDESILRSFEKCLLEELGYGPLPTSSISLKKAFSSDQYYEFIPEQGFVLSSIHQAAQPNAFSGENLLAMANEDWHEESLRAAKRLSRLMLAPLLGARRLHSRELFLSAEIENIE